MTDFRTYIVKYKDVIQIGFENLIPVIGLLLFGWTVDFIVFFYLLDAIVKEVITFFKYKELKKVHSEKQKSKSSNLFFLALSLIAFALYYVGFLTFLSSENSLSLDFNKVNRLLIDSAKSEFWIIPIYVVTLYFNFKVEFIGQHQNKVTPIYLFYKRNFIENIVLVVLVVLMVLLLPIYNSLFIGVIIFSLIKFVIDYLFLLKSKRIINQFITKGY